MDEDTSSKSSELHTRPNLRRPKPQLSCNQCRAKKLKCDRERPCKNCARLPAGSCVYVAGAPERSGLALRQRRGQTAAGKLQGRIQRLEALVASLAEVSAAVTDEDRSVEGSVDRKREGEGETQIANPRPQLTLNEAEQRFINSSHWEAILVDIASIREELASNPSSLADIEADQHTSANDAIGPQLLFATHKDISVDELICSVPPVSVVRELVRRLLDNTDMPPLLTILHRPSFIEQCEAFMENPRAVTLPWLSLLFGVMSLALQAVVRSGRKVEGVLLPETAARTYTAKAAQCLIASDYAKPTAYTVEALLFYTASEHYWIEDGHFRGSLLFNLCLRLALRMGYHRDPSHYSGISIFDSEMRRRTWSFMQQLDLMLAQKCGLPRSINVAQSDTRPALNVLDRDIWPTMSDLPTELPETQQTPIGFMNYKTRLLEVLGRIIDRANSSDNLSYEEVLDLDKELMTAAATRPAWLKPNPPTTTPDQDPTTTHSQLNRWVDADLILQRSRMILHRKFLVPAHTNARYTFSRDVCLTAAENTLHDQRKLFDESRNYDQTRASNWRFLSLSGHDFLLAAIIICLDIDQGWRGQRDFREGLVEGGSRRGEFDDKVELIRRSYEVWTGFLLRSASSRKAARILEVMLAKFSGSRGQGDQPSGISEDVHATASATHPKVHGPSASSTLPTNDIQAQHCGALPQLPLPDFSHGTANNNTFPGFHIFNGTPGSGASDLSAGPFQSMMDDPLMQMDWSLWDSEFREEGFDFQQ